MDSNAPRQGQTQGQEQRIAAFAKQHNVSPAWVRLIGFDAALDDPKFVIAIRDAAKVPELWAVVSPAAQEALFQPCRMIEKLGGSRDDLLGMLLESIRTLAHPINRNYATTHTPLQCVVNYLKSEIEIRLHNDAARGRVNLASTVKAATMKAQKALEASRAVEWSREVEERRPGISKEAVYKRLERRDGLQAGTVKKAVLRRRAATRR